MRLTSALVGGVLLAAMVPAPSPAQMSPAPCGTEIMSRIDRAQVARNTERNNPELHRIALQEKRDGRASLMRTTEDGLEWVFWTINRQKMEYERRSALLVYDGANARVWVDVADTGKSTHKPTSSTMRTLFKALDTAVTRTTAGVTPRDATKGILANDIDVFGQVPPDPQWDDKTNFFLLDISDAVQGQNVLGYFTQHDLSNESYSNGMNLLYVDSKEGFMSVQTLLNTIAHEFQHLIHWGRHPVEGSDPLKRDIIFNEGCSEVASILNGYWDRQNTGYLLNTNVGFFSWHPDDAQLLNDYERAMTFAHYLREHYGEGLLYALVGAQGENMARLDAALESIGSSARHMDVLKGFAAANQVRLAHAAGYRFLLNKTNFAPRPHVLVRGTPADTIERQVMQPYGISYAQYRNPGGMLIRFSGSPDVHIVMMGSRAGSYDIVNLDINTEYRIPLWEGARFDTVTFAIVSGSSAIREVSWVARSITLGVDDEAASVGDLAIGSVTRDEATIHSATAAPISAEVYDLRGLRVATLSVAPTTPGRTILDLSSFGLTTGGYVLRITQAGRAASRLFTVTN